MAKTNMIERDKRRVRSAKKYAAVRAQLKEAIRSPKSSQEERAAAQAKLQALPRDASPMRFWCWSSRPCWCSRRPSRRW